MEVKGLCKDCIFLSQDWTLPDDYEERFVLIHTNVCDIADIFKREDGYCDLWEPKIAKEEKPID